MGYCNPLDLCILIRVTDLEVDAVLIENLDCKSSSNLEEMMKSIASFQLYPIVVRLSIIAEKERKKR